MGFGILIENSNVTVASGDAIDMSNNPEIYVEAGVQIVTLDTDSGAAIGQLGDTLAFINGTLLGALGMGGNGDDEVTLSATGSIIASDIGIQTSGGFNQIVNAGSIFGGVLGLDLGSGGANILTNSGTITAGNGGLSGVRMAGGDNIITNTGTIIGDGAITFIATAGDGLNTIVNSGQLIGNNPYVLLAISAGDAPTTIVNTGSITGAVSLGDGNDSFTNKGTVTGDVTFGGGRDVYDGASGTVTGTIFGGSGQDTFDGGTGAMIFDMSAGGTFKINGGSGRDTIIVGSGFSSADGIDGGGGDDTVVMSGNYSGGLKLTHAMMTNVENLELAPDNSYDLILANATVAAGATLTIDGSALTATDTMIIDATRVANGYVDMRGGLGTNAIDFTAANFGSNDYIEGAGFTVMNFTTAGAIAAASFDNVAGVDAIDLANGTGSIAVNDALVATATGDTLTIYAGSGTETIDGSGVTSSSYTLVINAGSGNDTMIGGEGNDIFDFGATLTAADSINGGGGNDTLYLDGNYASGVTFSATTLTNIGTIVLEAGHNFSLTTNDKTVAAGATLTVNASALAVGDVLTFNGAAETDGHFVIESGLGADVLTGGALSDTFAYASGADSTSTHYDTINAFQFALDHIEIPSGTGPITGIDAAVTTGSLSTATFNADLKAALKTHLTAHDAILFTPNAGTLAGQTFLVVELNGTTGYLSGTDLVIHLAGATGTLAVSDFM